MLLINRLKLLINREILKEYKTNATKVGLAMGQGQPPLALAQAPLPAARQQSLGASRLELASDVWAQIKWPSKPLMVIRWPLTAIRNNKNLMAINGN